MKEVCFETKGYGLDKAVSLFSASITAIRFVKGMRNEFAKLRTTARETRTRTTNPIRSGCKPKSGKSSNRRRSSLSSMTIKTGKNILNGLTQRRKRPKSKIKTTSNFGEKSLKKLIFAYEMVDLKT